MTAAGGTDVAVLVEVVAWAVLLIFLAITITILAMHAANCAGLLGVMTM